MTGAVLVEPGWLRYISAMAISIRTWDPDRRVAGLLFLVGLGALIAAFAAEHLFGLEPCILCLYQRVPYALVAVLAVAALLLPGGSRASRWLIGACAMMFAAGALLAFYHVGVENHWWASIAGCEGQAVTELRLEDLSEQALAADPLKPCDRVDWRFLGLSLAGFNVIGSMALATLTVMGLHCARKGLRR
jgi:disulfide bond formation protein DsbB